MPPAPTPRTRRTPRTVRVRRLTAGTATAVLALAAVGCTPSGDDGVGGGAGEGGAEGQSTPIPHHEFVSRPDLMPPVIQVTRGPAWSADQEQEERLTLITPNYGNPTPSDGATILDATGELVWLSPSDEDDPEDWYFDLRVQEYDGEQVLTSYRGTNEKGRGNGDVVIMDQSYEEIARVTTGGSLGPGHVDFHDTTITPEGTMLVGSYVPTPGDLSSVGGPAEGFIEDAVIQEIDIATGEVVFEWSALDHVPLTETMMDFERKRDQEAESDPEAPELGTAEEKPFDYFHINSITEDDDGSLLVSARNTNAVYKLDRDSGEVEWTLGGNATDFEMGEGTVFSWQHDAHRAPDGTLTLLDNHAGGDDGNEESSRALRLALDERAMTAEVATEYLPPAERIAGSMANAQELEDGGMHVGWGARPLYSRFTADGELIYDVCHGDECMDGDEEYGGGGGTYRAYLAAWEGRPATDPDVVVQDGEENDGGPVAYVSWNGATEVAQWRLVAGADEASAEEVATVDRDGFETAMPVPDEAAEASYLALEALDESGEVLGTGLPN